MNKADHFKYALRVFVGSFVIAAVLSFGFAELFGVDDEREPLRLLFWAAMLGLFAAAISYSLAFVRANNRSPGGFLAFVTGAVAGTVFAAIALFPGGLAPGEVLTPIRIIWPVASGLAFLWAAYARYPSAEHADYSTYAVAPSGLLWALAVILILKIALHQAGPTMDFARARKPREVRLDVLRAEARHKLAATACPDSLKWRSVTDPDVAIDSSIALKPIGIFNTSGFIDRPPEKWGRRLHLWQTDGRYFGVLETWIGREVVRGWLEHGWMNKRGQFNFNVPYADGWAERFNGQIGESAPRGWLLTGDQNCMSSSLRHDPLQFTLDATLSSQQSDNITLANLRRRYSDTYVRVIRPSYPSARVPEPPYEVLVDTRPYLGQAKFAVVVTAHFPNDEQLRRILDPQFVIDVTSNLTLQQTLVSQAVDRAGRMASWVVALPTPAAFAYRSRLEQLRNDGSVTYLSSRLAPVATASAARQ